MMLTSVIMLLLMIMKSGVGEHCGLDTSVDITEGETFDNGTIHYNGTLFTPDNYYMPSENETRGCVCKIAKCYRKCCGRDKIYHEERVECVERGSLELTEEQNETMRRYFEEFQELEVKYDLRQVNGYNDLNECNNDSCLFRTDSYKSHELTKEGVLVVESVDSSDQHIDVDGYCIDIMLYFNEKTSETTLGREAYFRGRVYKQVEEYMQNYIVMLISAIFILMTIAVHWILPELKNSLHGRNLLCHLFSMLVSFLAIACMQMSIAFNKPTRNACMMFSFVIYVSLLAAFFWLNVMCFDMWRKFRLTRAIVSGDMQRRFRRYCLYAFGVPSALTVLLAILEFSPIEDNTFLPRMRKRECFLSGKGKLIYLYIPITYVCITNMVLFVLTTIHIVKTSNKTKKHLRSEDSKSSKAKDKQRLLTYVKLFIVMGVTWILEVVSFLFPQADVFWKISDAFNALSGFFIFVIVVCNKEKLLALRKRLKDIFKIKSHMDSTITLNTDLSQNVGRNLENQGQRKGPNNNTKREVRTTETQQNIIVDKAPERGSSFSQVNRINKCFEEESPDLIKGDNSQNNTKPEEVDSDTIDKDEYEIKYDGKEESENQRKINRNNPCNAELNSDVIVANENSNKPFDSYQENGYDASEKDLYVNKLNEEEKCSESENSTDINDSYKMSSEKVSQERNSSNIVERHMTNEIEVEIENNKQDPIESLKQVQSDIGAEREKQVSDTPEKENIVQKNAKKVLNASPGTANSVTHQNGNN